jgi:hypothetical protein
MEINAIRGSGFDVFKRRKVREFVRKQNAAGRWITPKPLRKVQPGSSAP